jgi:hypothetical protein
MNLWVHKSKCGQILKKKRLPNGRLFSCKGLISIYTLMEFNMRSVQEIEEDYSNLKLSIAKDEISAEYAIPKIDTLHKEIQASKLQLMLDDYLENYVVPGKCFKEQADRIFKGI